MGLKADLGTGPTAIDTSVFVYFIEEHRLFGPLVASLFADVAAGRHRVVTSSLTLLELLVVPNRVGDLALAERYERYLTKSHGLRLVEMSLDVLRVAAKLRADHASIRTPDAIQIATAISAGCASFLTNDRDLPAEPRLQILQLGSYV